MTGFETGDHGFVAGVRLANGDTVSADIVLVSIGVIPDTALAEAAGLTCDGGILVDEFTRTDDPAILAIGDCTRHRNLFFEDRLRLESVANAVDQARTAAAVLMGEDKPYDSVPWFWSNQYDLRLQTAGLSVGFDATVVRGRPEDRSFSVVYLKAGRVIALDCVNAVKDYVQGRKLVEARVSPDLAKLADAEVPLKELMPS